MRPGTQGGFSLFKRKDTHELEIGKKSEFMLQVNAGKMELNYTNSMLKIGVETMIEFKKLQALRDYNFYDIFKKRQTAPSRRLELMLPFYIVKKMVQNH